MALAKSLATRAAYPVWTSAAPTANHAACLKNAQPLAVLAQLPGAAVEAAERQDAVRTKSRAARGVWTRALCVVVRTSVLRDIPVLETSAGAQGVEMARDLLMGSLWLLCLCFLPWRCDGALIFGDGKEFCDGGIPGLDYMYTHIEYEVATKLV